MNGFNPQLYNIDRQIQEERAKMAELERQKIQAYSQPTILNQTIQTGPGVDTQAPIVSNATFSLEKIS